MTVRKCNDLYGFELQELSDHKDKKVQLLKRCKGVYIKVLYGNLIFIFTEFLKKVMEYSLEILFRRR